MTTDLTGDFGVAEDELDWDVFLTDPDETEVAAQAAALEDADELNLDDSDFDWEAALNEDASDGVDGADGARAGAAYDRIVDTVRRSFEEPEPEADAVAVAPADPEQESVGDHEPAHVIAEELEPALQETAPTPVAAVAHDDDVDIPVAFVSHTEPDGSLDDDIDDAVEFDDAPASATYAGRSTVWEGEPERESVSLSTFEPALESEAVFAPEPEEEPAFAPFAQAVTTVAAVGAMESAPSVPAEPHTWAMATDEPWDVSGDGEAPAQSDPDRPATTRQRKPRSRVFTAAVVLASLLLVAVVAAVAVRALHHATPSTSATAPVHATAPASAAAASAASAASATTSATARIQAATDAVDSATTAASVGLTSLPVFPTPTNVETVVNPYISSLQLYETFLSGTKVPAPAQAAAASAVTQLHQDLQFLDTIDGLPPVQLGAFLAQFETDTTRLQTTLNSIGQNLRTTTP